MNLITIEVKRIECSSKHKHAKLKKQAHKTLPEIFYPEKTFHFLSLIGFGLKKKNNK